MADDGVTYEEYNGDEPDFDLVDDFHVQEASDPEESWGDEEPSHDSDYSLISEDEFNEAGDGGNDLTPPVIKKNISNESNWELISLASVHSLADCSANSMAEEILANLESEQDLSGMSEPVLDQKASDIETKLDGFIKLKPKKEKTKKKKRKNVKCGIVLFRKNGAEILLFKKKRSKKGKKLTLISGSMKKHESPLESAIRHFRVRTGCTNLDRVAIVPHLIQSRDVAGKLYIFFPAVVNCNLQFMGFSPEAKSLGYKLDYGVEWIPTDVASRMQKRKIDDSIAGVVRDAWALLEANAHSLPTLVDEETAQLADMAHRDLFEFAQQKKISVTSAEVRDFLARNEEDLQIMFQDPDDEQMSAMLRKCVRQLQIIPVAGPDQPLSAAASGNLLRLQALVAACTSSTTPSWKKVNEKLHGEFVDLLLDDQVMTLLLTIGWNPEQQKFQNQSKGKKERKRLFDDCMQQLLSSAI